MPPAVGVAAAVGHPDVVAEVGQQEGQRSLEWHQDPRAGRLEDAVLEQHRLGSGLGDAVQFQDVAVVGHHLVPLGRIAAPLHHFDLGKRFLMFQTITSIVDSSDSS